MNDYYRLRENTDSGTWDVVTPENRVHLTISNCTETVAWQVVIALNASHLRALGK